MNFIARALTSTLALFASTAPVFATPSYFQDHVDLLETVMDVGVKVYVNSAHCDDGKFYGYYEPMGKGTLVICQTNRIIGVRKETSWTEEDLNTLRHEAHHLVQDCRGGVGRGDNKLVPIFGNERGVIAFARPILGDVGLQSVADMYSAWGAPWPVIVTEFEAFAVAEAVPARDIALAVEHNCRVK